MSDKNKTATRCDKATHVCDKAQYKEATIWEKLKLNIHLIFCGTCRDYSKNNACLTSVIEKSKICCLDKACKESMKKQIDQAIKENDL
ncbi:hypothetical protein [Gaetbulibacter saemankumensis]|uniref:hypothetical protein n=1 Tax=Gaetbulibacter saemankumensis TaxID=311208 RepID=UPI00048998E9|nr:hypothetical protein [Gaetbulibacter saemankumensis]